MPLEAQIDGDFTGEYARLIKAGDSLLANNSFDAALHKFQAAARADVSKEDSAEAKIQLVFDAINAAKDRAVAAEKATQEALAVAKEARQTAEKKRIEADTASARAERSRLAVVAEKAKSDRLVEYFFDPKTSENSAWAFGMNGKFGVIDREGKLLGDGFVWENPTPFQDNIARAQRGGDHWFIGADGRAISKGYNWLHLGPHQYWYAFDQYDKPIMVQASNSQMEEWGLSSYQAHHGSSSLLTYLMMETRDTLETPHLLKPDGSIIQPSYTNLEAFQNDYAKVSNEEGRIGLIDETGKMLIACQYDDIERFYSNHVWLKDSSGWGQFDLGSLTMDTMRYKGVQSYNEHYLKVITTYNDFGIFDSLGNEIIPAKYDYLEILPSGGYIAIYANDFVFFDLSGKRIGKKSQRYLIDQLYAYHNGLARLRLSNNKEGFINKAGEWAIPPKYYDVEDFENGFARVTRWKWSNYSGAINTQGDLVVRSRYDKIIPFSQGFIVKRKGQMGILNRQGEQMLALRYDKIQLLEEEFLIVQKGEKYAIFPVSVVPPSPQFLYNKVGEYGEGKLAVRRGDKWAYLNINAEASSEFLYVAAGPYRAGFALAQNEKGNFFFNHRNQIATDNPYSISPLGNGLNAVQQDSLFGFIDDYGNIMVPIIYQTVSLPTEDSLIRAKRNSRYGIINTRGETIIPFIYDNLSLSSDGLIRFESDGLWGFLNRQGELVIRAQFEALETFSEGMAAIKLKDKWGFINEAGEIIISPNYSVVNNFSGGFALVVENAEVLENGNYRGGESYFIDKSGKRAAFIDANLRPLSPFVNGMAIVEDRSTQNFGEGLVNQSGELLLEAKMQIIRLYADNFAIGSADTSSESYGMVDGRGKVVIPFEYQKLIRLPEVDNNKLIIARQNDKEGLFNTAGELIIPLRYDRIFNYSDRLIWVQEDGLMGAIDINGEVVIPIQYESASRFEKGLAMVREGDSWQLIDKQNQAVSVKQYDRIKKQANGTFLIQANDKIGLLNLDGSPLLSMEYEKFEPQLPQISILVSGSRKGFICLADTLLPSGEKLKRPRRFLPSEYEDFSHNYYDEFQAVKQNGKWGFVQWQPQADGSEVAQLTIPCRYEAVTTFYEHHGRMVARVYDSYLRQEFLINTRGEILFEAKE